MIESIKSEVLQAEDRRCKAMLSKDSDSLDEMLGADLVFTHATGAVDSKESFLQKFAAGRIEYLAIDWADASVLPVGSEGAVLTGRLEMQLRVDGTEKRLANRATLVWDRKDTAWRLLAFQTTAAA